MLIQNNAALLLIYLNSIGIIFASMDYHMTTNSIELLDEAATRRNKHHPD